MRERSTANGEDLGAYAAEALGGRKIIVVSNREPYMHQRQGGEIRCIRPAGGLVSALDPVMRAVRGVWVAHGAGDADRASADSAGRIAVPPDDPRYTLRRVWLTRREEAGYYYGFSNEALWPLCHVAYVRPTFRAEDWAAYEAVNRKFATAVLDETGDEHALVLIQDYHLALLPRMLREARPDLGIAHFWHIPWPTHEIFRVCPWRREILEGLLGNDLLGLQIQYHCIRFLECVDAELQVRVDREHQCVWHGSRVTYVRSFPIGTDAAGVAAQAESAETAAEAERLRRLIGEGVEAVAVGVDRLDYTKGIPERFEAIDRFLNENPAWRGRFQYLGVAAPSRTLIRTYQELSDRVGRLIDDINWRHGTDVWKPIVLLREHAGPATTRALYRLGRVCMVTSLHDGMNLVAKEYVAARTDGDGVLILSRFTGAARELTDAVLVNPYDAAATARAILAALEMTEDERRRRMERMRARVFERNVFEWARRLLGQAARRAEEPFQEALP